MPQQLLTQFIKPKTLQLVIKKFPLVVSFLLLILCINALLQIVSTLLVDDESTATTKDIPAIADSDVNNHETFRQLMDTNLFGLTTQKKTTITKVPETRLNLFLKGVFASTPMTNSTAIIGSGKNGREDSYSVGDKLTGGVTISEIHSDYVILDRNGRSEILRMPESKSVGELVSVIPDLSDVTQVHYGADIFDLVRNKIIAAPYTLRDYATPVAVMENNKLIGYRLQPKKEWYTVSDIGVEPDDIVTAVNNVRLNDPKNATKALRELITAKEVFITVKRGDEEVRFRAQLQ